MKTLETIKVRFGPAESTTYSISLSSIALPQGNHDEGISHEEMLAKNHGRKQEIDDYRRILQACSTLRALNYELGAAESMVKSSFKRKLPLRVYEVLGLLFCIMIGAVFTAGLMGPTPMNQTADDKITAAIILVPTFLIAVGLIYRAISWSRLPREIRIDGESITEVKGKKTRTIRISELKGLKISVWSYEHVYLCYHRAVSDARVEFLWNGGQIAWDAIQIRIPLFSIIAANPNLPVQVLAGAVWEEPSRAMNAELIWLIKAAAAPNQINAQIPY
jgi:hypothetical protein